MGFNSEYETRRPQTTHVAVLMGGWSREREVSLASGRAVTQGLEQYGYKVTQVDAQPDIAAVLSDLRPDVAFNALHGKWGEDGCVQGILETLKIPYTHSGVMASAMAMDKHRVKPMFKEADIPVADSRLVSLEDAASSHQMGLPYVIKPAGEGSSVGVHVVHQGAEVPPQEILEQRDILGDEVMVERFVAGRELTCAVMADVALGVIDIVPKTDFYDYSAKYDEGGSEHILPAEIPPEIYRRIQRYSLAAHNALGCKGVTRSDFRYDDTNSPEGELILLEVNTQPGMTTTSLVPEMAVHAGHSFSEFVHWMVQDASLER